MNDSATLKELMCISLPFSPAVRENIVNKQTYMFRKDSGTCNHDSVDLVSMSKGCKSQTTVP